MEKLHKNFGEIMKKIKNKFGEIFQVSDTGNNLRKIYCTLGKMFKKFWGKFEDSPEGFCKKMSRIL